MVEVIERETVNEAIEATVNYVLDNGEKYLRRPRRRAQRTCAAAARLIPAA